MASENISAAPDPIQRYWAFISYSQRDAEWAQRLQAKLESYRVPQSLVGRRTGDHTVPRRLIPVFRDRSELASAPDLAHEIREALQSSRSLIIICSPHAAASRWVEEEIRTFKTLGRGERIFPLIIDGEPNAPDGDRSLVECFAPSLRFDFRPDGTRTKPLIEPIAADARAGKDGWKDACLKLIAGILNVRFDELRRRELTRQRHRRLGFATMTFAGVVTIGLGYVGLADADFAVWGSAPLQRQLDRCGCSVFRRIPDVVEVFQASEAGRDRMRRDILAATSGGLIRKEAADRSVWAIAQLSAAVLRDPNLSLAEFRIISPILDRVFTGQIDFHFLDGKRVGWVDTEFWPRAEPELWMIMALSAALQHADLVSESERIRFVEYLGMVQEMAESYYPLRDGGWNMFPFGPPTHHFVYTTGIALHALLQLHSAGLCWRGDCNTLKKMIGDTARWLTEAFVVEEGSAGWRRRLDDDLPVVPDLSILISGFLVRAHLDAEIPLSDRIVSLALEQLTNLRLRSYDPSFQEISDDVRYTNSEGQTLLALRSVRVMWYPWAVEGLVSWLRYAERRNYPPEMKRALERSLGHVLITLSSAMLADMATGPKWAEGETSYGLAAVRREALTKWFR
jgi:hypothetical protein